MDIVDVFSSDSEDNHHSNNSQGRETISTQTHGHKENGKTKNIRKKYEPIVDCGKTYKYEDNPAQYKRLRKKIQNRESATRVRGRKKNAFEDLGQEVEYLRKENSHLQLVNAKLETENKSLKDQVQFMKSIIKPASKTDPVEEFLASEVLSHPSPNSQPSSMTDQYESPFFQEFNWIRSDSGSSQNLGWLGLAVFTIVLAVFVLPSQQQTSSTFVAWQNSEVTGIVIPFSSGLVSFINGIISYSKPVFKYGLILIYTWLLFMKIRNYLKGRKMKKI